MMASTALHAQPGIWSSYVNVSNNPGYSRVQSLAIGSDSIIHLVWQDNTRMGGVFGDVLYSYFNDTSWSEPFQISALSAVYSYLPAVAVDPLNRPHVVWNDNGYVNGNIFYSFRDSSGTWSAPFNVSAGYSYNYYPDIAIDASSRVHVVWHGASPGTGSSHILYRNFDGNQWQPILDIWPDIDDAALPKIKEDSQNHLHLCYRDYYHVGESTEIMYSHNDGNGWSNPVNISNSFDQNSEEADMVLDEIGNVHIVWKQYLPYIQGEIFYSYFDGMSWSTPQNISDLGGWCSHPTIAAASSLKGVTFNHGPPTGNPTLDFTFCTDSAWTFVDTLFQNPSPYGCESAMGFDAGAHMQIVSSPFCSPGSFELLHQTYVNSPEMLPTTLNPHSTPIIIPPTGGSFSYDVRIENQVALPLTFDAWIEVALPSGSVYGPILLRQNLTLPSQGAIIRTNLVQNVPGGAPAGEYFYYLRAGDYADSVVVSSDSFAFVKAGVTLSADGEWLLDGWDSDLPRDGKFQPSSSILHSCSPNPFNAVTVASYELRVASHVSLRVYDTAGRMVTTLVNGWRPAGTHEVTFDGSRLASGVYIYRLQAGDFHAAKKMILLK